MQWYHMHNPIPDGLFTQAYALMQDAFPPTERRTFAGQRALLANPHYRLRVQTAAGSVTALMAVWEFSHFRFVEHIAVSPSLRGQGVGGKWIEEYVAADALPVILEVEPPETELAARRIGFYKRHGFHTSPFAYQQPSMQDGQPPIPLILMQSGAPLTKADFLQVRDTLYHEVYNR